MSKFYRKIVNHPKLIIVTFIVMFVLCALLRGFVGVNYDMKDYLPKDSPSTISLEFMQKEFEGGIPNARVMIRNITVSQALEYKEKLLSCVGVNEVMWLDDAADIHIPLETLDSDTVETYYKDEAALFTVTIDKDRRGEAVPAIRAVIGDENAMSGDAVTTVIATASTVSEIGKIASIAVVFVFIVLILTTPSWLEPVVVMIGLGVAVIINAGSNVIFGEISFVTNAAGNILQLAVSLDYSVFLMHRFEECLQDNLNPKEAMVEALCKSTTSILSSGLTTVIGFLALVFMRFGIGPDLGLALAKGIAISLITVFVFMPVLILAMNNLLNKTRHRSFMPSFEKFGKLIYRVMIPMVCLFAILVVPSYLASNSNSFYYGSSRIFGEETQLGSDMIAIEKVFGKNDTYILMVPRRSTATEKELSDALHELPAIKSILSYADTVGIEIPMEYLPVDTLSKLESPSYSRMVISVDANYEGEETFALVEEIRGIADEYFPECYYLAGEAISTYDLMNTITADMLIVNLIAIGAVFVVLLIAMKSISLPAILVLSIETAVWINLSIPYFNDSLVFYISYLIISAIQLGATVDYAILLTDRYMEYRKTLDKKQAIIGTMSAVTVSMLTSGTVLTAIGFLLGKISSHGILSQLGMFLGIGGLLSLAIVLFVLPGLLYLCDGIIRRTTLGLTPQKQNVELSEQTIDVAQIPAQQEQNTFHQEEVTK